MTFKDQSDKHFCLRFLVFSFNCKGSITKIAVQFINIYLADKGKRQRTLRTVVLPVGGVLLDPGPDELLDLVDHHIDAAVSSM